MHFITVKLKLDATSLGEFSEDYEKKGILMKVEKKLRGELGRYKEALTLVELVMLSQINICVNKSIP